ncbi:PA2928 family protein [Glycomyces sp. NPDC049804]|uniref:PA2928 family protein n=1 Tax=Glycomyces sp. NPDC049804 TaxID=3154363 RepID=UPI00341C3566
MSHVPGYSSARPFPPQQRVRSPYGTPDHPLTPQRRRGRGFGMFGGILLSSLVIAVAAIVGEHVTAPDPDIAVHSGIGFAVYGGEELALVPYDRNGSGGLVDAMRHGLSEVRLAAVELSTGDMKWDVELADRQPWPVAVLAAGDHFAYVSTDNGLMILDLADGGTVAEPGAVPGLERSRALSGAAYGFDPALDAVVALDVDGGVQVLPLDALEAEPADAATTATWSGVLFAEGSAPDIGGMTSTEALLADGESTVRLEPTADGALGGSLVVDGPDGKRALGTRVFYGAGIVLDQTSPFASFDVEIDVDALIAEFLEDPAAASEDLWTGFGNTAAGAGAGHVLVEHQPEPGVDAYALHVVDLDTGQVTASTATGSRLGRALTSPGGYTAVIAAPEGSYWLADLVLVAPGGSLERVEIGRP